MQRKIQKEVRERLFRNRSNQKFRMVSAALSVLVVMGTVGGLILPAQTLTRKTQVLDCQYATHTHTEACYAKDDPSNENEEKHLICGYADYVVHRHDDNCYQDGKLVCTLPEIPEHKHTDACYQEQQMLTCGMEESAEHQHDANCYEMVKVLTCGQQELHTHTADCYDENGQQTCGLIQLEQHQHGNACFKTVEQEEPQAEQNEPAPAEAVAAQPEANTNESNVPAEAPSESAPVTAETPPASTPVTAETPAANAPTQNTEQQETPAAVGMPAQQFDGKTGGITVHTEAPEGALPEGTSMTVTKVTEKTVIDSVADAVNGKVKAVEAVDITFRNASGQEIEPEKEIRVTMTSKQIAKAEESVVVHVDDEGKAEVVEKKEEKPAENAVVFNADAFSVYALAYTVDFEYEVDGKTYKYSMQGGSAIGLKELLPVLGVVKDNTATEKNEVDAFVSDIADVRFSHESLVQVAHVDKDTTVGALKDKLGLDIQYSSELTEEQIAKINAKELKAVDWALISLKPFTSNETLTVTMKDGEMFTVKVTDAQIDGNLDDGGKYLIYYNTGSGNNQTYHVLKNDGTVYHTTNSNDLDTLGDDYLWTFDHYNRFGEDYSLIHNGSTYITLNGSSAGILSNVAIPTYMKPISDAHKGFRMYGVEWVSTGWFSGYNTNHYLTYNGSNFVREDNENGNTRIKLWEQSDRRYNFTVKTEYNNVYRGTVSGKDENGSQQTKVASFVSITNTGKPKTNAYPITAVPGDGYHFKEWRLGETVLTDFTSPTINAGSLAFTEDDMILTAVFEKDAGSGGGETDYSAIINKWKDDHLVSELDLDKTAQVFDYDNRIYQVDLTASGKTTIIAPNIELAFVTDVSRSMYFPAELGSPIKYRNTDAPGTVSGYSVAKDFVVKILDEYRNNRNWAVTHSADGDDVYYLIADPNGKSTVYAVRKNTSTNKWMYIDASYDIRKYPKNGATQGSDIWKVKNTDGDEVGWKVLADGITFSNGHLKLDGYDLDGQIYVAKDVRYRLDYLQQAVDAASEVVYSVNPGAEIGLVTFAGDANNPVGLYGKEQYGELLSNLNDIAPEGGTNQKAGLDKAKQFWTTASDPNHQRVVIMVTDGAPNPTSGTLSWSQIAASAGELYSQKSAKVHTVGLSIKSVTGAEDGLRLTAQQGGNGKFFSAEKPDQLINNILSIVELYLKEANLKGTLHDDIDRAFYPVQKDGTPIRPGYYKADGTPIDLATVQSYNDNTSAQYGTEYYLWNNNGGQWSITWYNLEFGKGTPQNPATHKEIYLKSKEDFMGGNNINTNVEEAHAIGSKGVYRDGSNVFEQPLEVIKEAMAETPHVNVDELHLTQHNTEWTVYLGTDVTPKEQLEELWNNIKVKQVVKEGGTVENDTMMTEKGQMWYPHQDAVNGEDKAAPANSDEDAKLALSHYGLDSYYDALLTAITNGTSYDSQNIAYAPYEHGTVGNFRITATKVIDSGANDARENAPDQHTTDKAVSPAETYKITVTYTPLTTGAEETYEHTTSGGSAGKVTAGSGNDEVKSENEHKINVIKKGLEIEKVDESGEKIEDYAATFKLYRPAQGSEQGTTVTGLGDGYHEVATLITTGGSASLSDSLQELRLLPSGQHYYLVETQQPTGYEKLSSPIQVDVVVTPGQETKPYEASEEITTLVNVGTPTAAVRITGSNAEIKTNTDGKFVIKVTNRSGSVDITIHKVDNRNVPLPGAVFKLLNGSEIVPVSANGQGVVVEPKVAGETVTITDNTFTIPAGGVTIKNLKSSENKYSLVEVSAPDGYVITNNTPVEFKVSSGNVEDRTMTTGVTYTPEGNDFTVPNTPGAALPNTGGIGTTIFYVIGTILVVGAGVLLVTKKRLGGK